MRRLLPLLDAAAWTLIAGLVIVSSIHAHVSALDSMRTR